MTAGPDIVDDSWHHLVGIYDGYRAVLYVDGEFAASQNSTHTPMLHSKPMAIGSGTGDGTQVIEGDVDEVMLFNYAKSPLRVRQLFQDVKWDGLDR